MALSLTPAGRRRYSLYYAPAPNALRIAAREPGFTPPASPILLAKGDIAKGVLVMYPLNTTATSPGFLEPKHGRLQTITFQDFTAVDEPDLDAVKDGLLSLPAGFIKSPVFGLGIMSEYRQLVQTILEIEGVTDLRLVDGKADDVPTVEGSSFVVSRKRLDAVRRTIGLLHRHALEQVSSEKSAAAFNQLVRPIDPERYPTQVPAYRRGAVLAALGDAIQRSTPLSATDDEAVVRVVRASVPRALKADPSRLLELTRDIEVVSLEILVQRMKLLLARPSKEAEWQTFLTENPFVLRLAFNLPVMVVGGQLTVGGRRFSGGGEKIVDFAVKALVTGNLSLVEIKTPGTPLLETRPYRGSLYGPSRDLAAATAQVLDQRHHLQQEIAQLARNSRMNDIESYAINCLIVAGRDLGDGDRQKSFELYRNALNAVSIVTFDELLAKVEALLAFLQAPGEAGEADQASDETLDVAEDGEDPALEDDGFA